MKDTDIEITHI